jgi:hypothetical protein
MMHINSPRTDDDAIEQEIRSKGLNGPRITPQDIEGCHHPARCTSRPLRASWATPGPTPLDARAIKPPEHLDRITICVLTLRNGYTIVGTSACASPENFDATIGRKIARQNATQQIWPLLGYVLRSVLNAEQPLIPSTTRRTPPWPR